MIKEKEMKVAAMSLFKALWSLYHDFTMMTNCAVLPVSNILSVADYLQNHVWLGILSKACNPKDYAENPSVNNEIMRFIKKCVIILRTFGCFTTVVKSITAIVFFVSKMNCHKQ